MISYEKVRQTLKSLTAIAIFYNSLSLLVHCVSTGLGIWFYHVVSFDSVLAQEFTRLITPWSMFQTSLNFIAPIAFLMYFKKIQRNLDEKKTVGEMTYILGAVYTFLVLLFKYSYYIMNGVSLNLFMLLPIGIVALYAYCIYQARCWNRQFPADRLPLAGP